MIKAIVYTSNTGNTEKYAKMLAEETGPPVMSLDEAKCGLERGSEIVYLGWLMASHIKGFKQAAKRFDVKLVCAVGLIETGSGAENIRKLNGIAEETELFTLQGGFYLDKLSGFYHFSMKMMAKGLCEEIAKKEAPTQQDKELARLLTEGGSLVSRDKLTTVIEKLAKMQGE